MDRIISLLAALVGLIALGGAILVHVNGDTQRAQMAAEIAQLKVSVGLMAAGKAPVEVAAADPAPILPSAGPQASSAASSEPPSSVPLPSLAVASSSASAPASTAPASSSAPDDRDAEVKALMDRVASLEQQNQQQASELDAARAQLSVQPSTSPSSTNVAAIEPPSSSASPQPAALAADGPTKDCIPLGTRFMGTAGDSFPICKTKLVLKVMGVSDGLASIVGPGDVAVGATVPYDKGCSVAVFSADTSGYAEMRVTCS